MKEEEDYYPYYEKLTKMSLEEPIVETPEFRLLAERYPHLAESVRLRREVGRLRERLRSQKEKSTKFRLKRDIQRLETKLKQEDIQKRLHGESKQEALFKVRFGIETSKNRVSSIASRAHNILTKAKTDARSVDRVLRRSIRKKLPPTVFDLKSLDTGEKGLSVREWLQQRKRNVDK